MKPTNPEEALRQMLLDDPRYSEEAYRFVQEGLSFTARKLERPAEGPGRHISGAELLDGLREYALQEYGPMAKRVLNHWGVHSCIDFGHIVFNMVEAGMLGKTEEDSLRDFEGGYDFDEAFRRPYAPDSRSTTRYP
ncbi:Minf_1886 family protein [Kiritimatiella glycovorans]|uniref:Protein restricted to Verrucomicrobia-Planctomycetes group n=1 Tax=Kiritimatiella glycovorans TaxID=1307763 RepID=A0A0G3EG24_9BACT|nr:Minf_1886 family protein [Kiritimatiella glycovorans]AKJ64327.1 protein restricted to Verrucomicrobia-Planctomycetes group [Kiritimatiella glycovorans]